MQRKTIFEWNFGTLNIPLEAIYYHEKRPWILLSRNLFQNKAHFRSVFAEELGHHFTSTGDRIIKAGIHYQEILEIGREEHRELVWAARILISIVYLGRAFCSSLMTVTTLTTY